MLISPSTIPAPNRSSGPNPPTLFWLNSTAALYHLLIQCTITHSDAQIAQIAASIREFGFTNPVLVDGKQGIIAGHGRVLAARKLGMDLIPTIELAYLSETQRQAYIIADNKLAENAGWGPREMLRLELGDLKELGFAGFSHRVFHRSPAPGTSA
jgi:hypothetical protein